jgi:hypothetical protein
MSNGLSARSWRGYRGCARLENRAQPRRFAMLIAAFVGCVLTLAFAPALFAQDMDNGGGMTGPQMMPTPEGEPEDQNQLKPLPGVPMGRPISGSMMVAPPYGNAPLKVGFFVLATDPENLGFLTYEWNFGDGTVSSLPPELYIFHTYAMPGNYLCTLVLKTIDGRSMTMMQGVVVVPMSD